MINANIKIILDNGQVFDIGDPSDLGIKLNRIVDDFANINARFGDFSYTVSLPITRNNRKIWEFPDVKGRTRIFKGKSFACKLFNGNDLLLQGIIELQSFDNEKYSCVFYSSLTPLLDSLKGKKINQTNSLSPIVWQYEKTIINHIRSRYLNSDQTTHVFPIIFYETPFSQGAFPGYSLPDPPDVELYMAFVPNYQFPTYNPRYYSSYPPAFFLVTIMESILKSGGWTLGGSFFQDQQIKKIIVPFVGSNETFSGAVISGSTNYLDLNRLLPDVDCVSFLSSIINVFNLYFNIDPVGKQISFETGNVLFSSVADPYDLTDKIDKSTIAISKVDDESTITFSENGNTMIGGYDRILDYTQLGKLPSQPGFLMTTNNRWRNLGLDIPNSYYGEANELKERYKPGTVQRLWNKTSGTGKDVKLGLSIANTFEYSMPNHITISGNTWLSTGENTISYSIPLISSQTATDNNGKGFCRSQDENYVEGNDPKNIDYSGGLSLYYWYGNVQYDATVNSRPYKDWCWIGCASGGSATAPTLARVPATIASPFKLLTVAEKNRLFQTITGTTTGFDKYDVSGAEAHNLLMTYYTVGKTADPYSVTNYSLTLGENSLFPNLYSTFHEQKFIAIRDSFLLNATIRINSFDWSQLTMNRVIRYDDQLYRLVAIKNYDPVENSALITLMRR